MIRVKITSLCNEEGCGKQLDYTYVTWLMELAFFLATAAVSVYCRGQNSIVYLLKYYAEYCSCHIGLIVITQYTDRNLDFSSS